MVLSGVIVEKMAHCETAVLNTRRTSPATEVEKDKNGVEQSVRLTNSNQAICRVSLHGGQVILWQPAGEPDRNLLFKSKQADENPSMAVRGGIPIIFPQFGNRGSLEKHGFARKRKWAVEEQQPPSPNADEFNPQASTTLLLTPTEEDIKAWPYRFEIRLKITLTEEGNLILRSSVKNTNGKPFSFSIALRTYFAISDISEVRVEGLETLDYLDNLDDKKRFTEQGDALTFESEVDRIYVNSADVVAIFDHGEKRTFQLTKKGLPDIAVWNPWEKKAKSLADLGDEEYKHMLCIDGAVVEKPITLKAGEEWVGQMELSVRSSC